MKRLALFAAAVAMVSGVSYISFARDEAKIDAKPVTNITTEPAPSGVTPAVLPTSPSNQPSVKADSDPQMGETEKPASAPEKKSEPVTENKPAATLSDVGKSTGQNVVEQGKSTGHEAVKSTMPSASVPATPSQAVAKTVGTPTPVSTPSTMPTTK